MLRERFPLELSDDIVVVPIEPGPTIVNGELDLHRPVHGAAIERSPPSRRLISGRKNEFFRLTELNSGTDREVGQP